MFQEENVAYRLDSQGGVHFRVDEEFAHSVATAVGALSGSRYGAARGHFESAQVALDQTPPATRDAVRQTFEAVETLFKLMFPDVAVLGAVEVRKKLRSWFEAQPDGTERDASKLMCDSFVDWVNAAHPYRHGQATEVVDNPSIPHAVLVVSMGAAYLRWLAGIDHERRAN